ncbi:MAG: hypothetical protein JRG93_17745 [Deltaproteobacteria bacterium]|nr:hypothetical protein [Deltaproteobacteria bacterium]MBW2403347.1 hypothetical protein [Deltaproteobacteria bacterium]
MRYLFGFLCSCALGLAPVVGCGETTGDGGSGGSAGNGGMGGDGGDGGANTATVIVHASGFEPPQGTTGPLEGVQVCETGTTNCVMTGADGIGELELPVDQETSVTLDKEGRGSYLHSVIIPAEGAIVTQGLALDARLEDMYGRVMSPYPPEGAGTAFVDLRNVAGATFELVGTTGKAFYRDEELNWSLDFTATTSDGTGGFVEVSPGVVQIDIGGTADNCVLVRGWPGDSENSARMLVREGYFSHVTLECDEVVP